MANVIGKKLITTEKALELHQGLSTIVNNKVQKEEGKELMPTSYKSIINALPEVVGDMTKTVYDTDNDGIVDKAKNANTVNNLTVETAVPSGAVFTDTTYEIATTSSNGLLSALDKTKLDGIEKNANNFTLEPATSETLGGVKIGSGISVISDGTISVTKPAIPTKVSELENDSNYTTAEVVEGMIADIKQFEVKVVASLPPTGSSGIMYLIPSTKSADRNVKDEYIWIDSTSSYELIGSTAVDLTGYIRKDDLQEASTEDIQAILNLYNQ